MCEEEWWWLFLRNGDIFGSSPAPFSVVFSASTLCTASKLATRSAQLSSAPPISKPSFWLLINLKKWKKPICTELFCCCENRRKWMRDWKSMKPNWRRKRRSMSLKNPCSFGVLSKFSYLCFFIFLFLFDTVWLLRNCGKRWRNWNFESLFYVVCSTKLVI